MSESHELPVLFMKSSGNLHTVHCVTLREIDICNGIIHAMMPLDSSIHLLQNWTPNPDTNMYIGYVDSGRPDEFDNVKLLLLIQNCQPVRLEIAEYRDFTRRHLETDLVMATVLVIQGDMVIIGYDDKVKRRLNDYAENVIGG